MEVFAVDTVSGREEALDVDLEDTVYALKRRSIVALGYDPREEVQLFVDGVLLEGDSDQVCSLSVNLECGSRITVEPTGDCFIEDLRHGEKMLHDIPHYARHKRACTLAAVSSPSCIILDVDQALWGDKEVMLAATKWHVWFYYRATEELRSDKDMALAVVEQDSHHYWDLPAFLRNDVDLAMAYVNAAELAELDDDLRDNEAVVLEAMQIDGSALEHASKRLRDSTELALRAVTIDPSYLETSGPHQADESVVLTAMRYCPPRCLSGCQCKDLLRHASPALRATKDVVLAAVSRHSSALRHASPPLRADPDVVIAAVSSETRCSCQRPSLRYAAPQALSDKPTMLAVVREAPGCITHASPTLQDDKDIALAALEAARLRPAPPATPHEVFRHLSAPLRGDPDVVFAALLCGDSGAFASPLFADKAFLCRALEAGHDVFEKAAPALRSDRDVLLLVAQRNPQRLMYACRGVATDREVALTAVRNGGSLQHIQGPAREDKEVVLAAVEEDCENFKYASPALRANKEVALAAVSHPWAEFFPWLGDALRNDRDVAFAAIMRDETHWHAAGEEARAWCDPPAAAATTPPDDIRAAIRENPSLLLRASPELKDMALLAVVRDPRLYWALGPELRGDTEVALAVVRRKQGLLCDTEPTLHGNREVVMRAHRLIRSDVEQLPEALRDDGDVMVRAAGHDPSFFAYASPRLRDDPECVRRAITACHECFAHAGEGARNDPDVVRHAILATRTPAAVAEVLRHAGPAALACPRVAEDALLQCGDVLPLVDPALRTDAGVLRAVVATRAAGRDLQWLRDTGVCVVDSKEVMLRLLAESRDALILASDELRGDKDVALEALRTRHDGEGREGVGSELADTEALFALLAEPLQRDPDVVRHAVRNGVRCGASPLFHDRGFVMQLLGEGQSVAEHLPEHLCADREVMLLAAPLSGTALAAAPPALRQDREVALAAVRGRASLRDVCGEARDDKEVVIAALQRSASNFHYVGDALRADKDVAMVVATERLVFQCFSDALRDDPDVALPAIAADATNFALAGETIRCDRDVALAAVGQHTEWIDLLFYVGGALQHDPEIARAAVEASATNINYVANDALRAALQEEAGLRGSRRGSATGSNDSSLSQEGEETEEQG